jgi:predicted ATP-dependent serine protease
VYVTAEDSWESTLVPRLIAAGADLDRIVDVAVHDDDGNELGLSLPEDIAELRDAIEQTSARLIVIDRLVAFLSDRIDSHKDHSIRRALGALKRLADETDAAIVGIVHLNKGDSRQAADRIIGSVGFHNAVRSVLLFTEDPDEEHLRILTHVKANLGPRSVSLRFGVKSRSVIVDPVGEIPTVGLSWLGEAPEVTATMPSSTSATAKRAPASPKPSRG